MQSPWSFIVALLLIANVSAINIFEQMFQGGGGGQPQQPQQAPSDPGQYQNQYYGAVCDRYLCPDTLACVHFPHHCPCAHPELEDKVELGKGAAVCGSKGGFKTGELARKVELARKGLL